MIQRPYYENMLRARLAEERHFIQVVLGPRQVGKTTLVRQVLSTIQIPYSFYTADTEPGLTKYGKKSGWRCSSPGRKNAF